MTDPYGAPRLVCSNPVNGTIIFCVAMLLLLRGGAYLITLFPF